MFDHGPCNCKSVKGTCASSNLIQNQQAPGCGISKDICYFCHFHHESTLSACKVIRCTDTCKDSIHNANICFLCRNKTSDLRHQNDQCCLTHISGFTSHIRTGDNGNSFFLIVQICIICNKHIIFNHLLYNRMTTIFDIQNTIFINLRSYKIVSFCHKRKRGKHIQCCNRLGSFLDTYDFFANFVTDICKQFIFQRIQTIFSSKDQILKILQLLCNITFGIGQCLFANIIIRNLIFERIRHFQCITKYTTVFDLQCLNAGTFFFSCFQFSKPLFAISS